MTGNLLEELFQGKVVPFDQRCPQKNSGAYADVPPSQLMFSSSYVSGDELKPVELRQKWIRVFQYRENLK